MTKRDYSMDDFRAEMNRRGVPRGHQKKVDRQDRLGPWISKLTGRQVTLLKIEMWRDVDYVEYQDYNRRQRTTVKEFLRLHGRKITK